MTDSVNDTFEVQKCINVPKPNNTKALRFQSFCSFFVTRESFGRIVLPAVQFNDKSATVTGEIGDKSRNRDLTAKMPAFPF